jgi:uncharacterized DUF497 family protein
MTIEFEWDEDKNAANIVKHGIAFEEAKKVFFDPMRVDYYDPDHSKTEERWKVFGMAAWALVMVSYVEKQDVIRIISARKTTHAEEEFYFDGYCTYNGE